MSKSRDNKKYTALFYVHGMGEQVRYEEVSRLIDRLDQFLNSCDPTIEGRLRQIRANREIPRIPELKKDLSYVNLTRFIFKDKKIKEYKFRESYRLYEAYWSGFTAGGASPISILKWIARQFVGPLRGLTATWRENPKLKSAALLKTWPKLNSQRKIGTKIGKSMQWEIKDIDAALKFYDRFESWEARRKYPEGSFEDFLKFAAEKTQKDTKNLASRRERIPHLLKRWQKIYRVSEYKNLFFITTLILTLFSLLLALFFLAEPLISTQAEVQQAKGFFQKILFNLSAEPLKAVFGLSALGLILMIFKFLRFYVADVMFWTTLKETNPNFKKREKILTYAANLLEHILRDDKCKRVVIVGHSLGTAVAYDVLRELGGRFKALENSSSANASERFPLEKIDALITFGSPIERIHYFFETHKGKYHRYNRLNQEFRGDVGEPPFYIKPERKIRWINLWDSADIISSQLHTPKPFLQSEMDIGNLCLVQEKFPNPVSSHSAYFNNFVVLSVITRVLFFNDLPEKVLKAINKENFAGEIGAKRSIEVTRKIIQGCFLALPWTVIFASVASFIGTALIFKIFSNFAGILIFIIGVMWVILKEPGSGHS